MQTSVPRKKAVLKLRKRSGNTNVSYTDVNEHKMNVVAASYLVRPYPYK